MVKILLLANESSGSVGEQRLSPRQPGLMYGCGGGCCVSHLAPHSLGAVQIALIVYASVSLK